MISDNHYDNSQLQNSLNDQPIYNAVNTSLMVLSEFHKKNQSNASPNLITSTVYKVPSSTSQLKECHLPFGIVVTPFSESAFFEEIPYIPLINAGDTGPVRCKRCKAYMSPFMKFTNCWNSFQCALCECVTEIPFGYYKNIGFQNEMKSSDYPELSCGAYEFVVGSAYNRENRMPGPPVIIFAIDVSFNNIKSGFVEACCSEIQSIIEGIQAIVSFQFKVGFITYDNSVHFYDLSGSQPKMLIVSDLKDIFLPYAGGFFVDPVKSLDVISYLLQEIPHMFTQYPKMDVILAPVIVAAVEAAKGEKSCCKIILFHSSLPTFSAPGRLNDTLRDNLFDSQNEVYNDLAKSSVLAGCSVDIFFSGNAYIDLPTIGRVSSVTGGNVFDYSNFDISIDRSRLSLDLQISLKRIRALDAVMKMRTSQGISVHRWFGNYLSSEIGDIELPAITCDKSIAFEFRHDDSIADGSNIYLQVAVLFTSVRGIRTVRVINLELQATSLITNAFSSCELDTIMNYLSKKSLSNPKLTDLKLIKEDLFSKAVNILIYYRKFCARYASETQLILPKTMELFPLYLSCLLKTEVFSGKSVSVDRRWFHMNSILSMSVERSRVYIYPRVISLDEPYKTLPCSFRYISDDGVYLIENGIYLIIWISQNVSFDFLKVFFGVTNLSELNYFTGNLQNKFSQIGPLYSLINSLNSSHQSYRQIIIFQGGPNEVVLKNLLYEDSGPNKSHSYEEFICSLHRSINHLSKQG